MKRFFLIIGISIVSQVAVAQWTFTTSVSKSGNCSGRDALGANIWAAIGQGVSGQNNFATKEQCEASRASFSGTYSEGGCTTRVITTPCKGPAGALNGVDILGPSKGSSFYSTNPVNEINDWSKDHMERMLTLNPEYTIKQPETIDTKDFAYDQKRNEYRLSGKMPEGNSFIVRSDAYYAQKRESRNNEYLISKDRTSDRPLLYELGRWSSDDLKPVELPPETVRLYGDINYDERKGGITDKVKTTLSSLDERLDWYKAEDGNVFQYMYTRWGKENVMAGVDLWEKHHVGERISNIWSKVKEVASDPLGALEKKREEVVDGINERKGEYLSSGFSYIYKPGASVENAQGILKAVKGTTNDVSNFIKKSVNDAYSGNVPDDKKILEKAGDDYSGLASTVIERSTGFSSQTPLAQKITKVLRAPKEQQKKEFINITNKEIKKQTKSAVKKSEFYKSTKGKITNLLDPNHLVTD